jgi:hypothetical protein
MALVDKKMGKKTDKKAGKEVNKKLVNTSIM